MYKLYAIWVKKRHYNNARFRVCVDLNYINWRRTTEGESDDSHIFYIPNCCTALSENEVQAKLRDRRRPVTVLFARRFREHRGTRIFGEAALDLLKEFPEMRIVIAGDGPDEGYLRKQFEGRRNVTIGKVPWEQMSTVLKGTDVAVVPSLASEGTSFSLAEAMGSACAVIASNVGGMTNMVIDNYNGLLIWPRADECLAAMRELVLNTEKRRRLASAAWETARTAFSEDLWHKRWRNVIEAVLREDQTTAWGQQSF